MNSDGAESRIPVLIAKGEVNDRPQADAEGMDSIGLMQAALAEAERDADVRLMDKLDWLGVEDQISFPDPALLDRLAASLPKAPRFRVKTPYPMGDGPVMLINEAANLIGRGEIRLAVAVGGEALKTAVKRAKAETKTGTADQSGKRDALRDLAAAGKPTLASRYGLVTPADVYPLYENATRAAWGLSLSQAQAESALIWSEFSKVAASNPFAWLREAVSPQMIARPGPDNRMISFPYTKLMVANSSVNQGAAVVIASLAMACSLGIPESRLVYIGRGAKATEPKDFLKRDSYAHVTSLETTISAALETNDLEVKDIDFAELYSCFPCIPKLARRVLKWPAERPASVYGGLTFGGGPIGNCMMHGIAQMMEKLRAEGGNGLVVGNGGYATSSHSIVLSRTPTREGLFPQDYDFQAAADARRCAVPELLESYEGSGHIETYAVPFARHGVPKDAIIVGRTPQGARFLASVPADDHVLMDFLMSGYDEPVGSAGVAILGDDGRSVWMR